MAVVSNPVVVMKRYEMKYIMSPEQTEYFKESVKDYMKIDKFGLTSIASLYYDTPNYRLIRTSVEKPPFKEKIRLRSYGIATDTSPVFLELKRKAYGIVYKRRVQSTIPLVKKFFDGEGDICVVSWRWPSTLPIRVRAAVNRVARLHPTSIPRTLWPL